jgi:hypothetical protein
MVRGSLEPETCLLVKRLGVGGGGGDVSVTSSLVGAGGLLEVLGSGQVNATSGVVGGGVVGHEVEDVGFRGTEHGEHGERIGSWWAHTMITGNTFLYDSDI